MRATCLAALCVLAACHAKVSGDIQVDGKPFAVTDCRSGQALGFNGLQVADEHGLRIRMILQADGTAQVALLPYGATTGSMLGTCAQLELHPQNSRINEVRNVEGSVHFTCDAGGHAITGGLSFENCH